MGKKTSTQAPSVALSHLDQLWFQVGGTLCNITCHHCFISCSPTNRNFGFLSLEQVRQRLEESVSHGVKEYYFTGGEPFLNREMVAILEETLNYGPATVLTNGTILKEPWLKSLRKAEQKSLYSLEFRVSIDGFSPETNDPIRGKNTFRKAIQGVTKLVKHGFLPIITAARTWPIQDEEEILQAFISTLKEHGYTRPRLKILPTLQIGAEAKRTNGYLQDERVTEEMMQDFDTSQLLCEHSRIITDRGVQVCPILIEEEGSQLGQTLNESKKHFSIRHGACFTCYQYGAICSNPSGQAHRE
ncbi:Antilisterial bacteriocin subtilosin biosynthesis protein AlbA [Planctomycetales bacterium 10988]|nr:Antilisterial bacteriocin subtilosin biosynthesis protein AlbA [Planctomycetales bacterium 10988]